MSNQSDIFPLFLVKINVSVKNYQENDSFQFWKNQFVLLNPTQIKFTKSKQYRDDHLRSQRVCLCLCLSLVCFVWTLWFITGTARFMIPTPFYVACNVHTRYVHTDIVTYRYIGERLLIIFGCTELQYDFVLLKNNKLRTLKTYP